MENAIKKIELRDGQNISSYRKEQHFYKQLQVVALKAGKWSMPITARFYATSQVHYCCIWISGEKAYGNGAGKASGYGYHKESAALQAALDSAGVSLAVSIDGVGDDAMKSALEAIARKMGYGKFIVTQAHA